jgi:hypothetical protein
MRKCIAVAKGFRSAESDQSDEDEEDDAADALAEIEALAEKLRERFPGIRSSRLRIRRT